MQSWRLSEAVLVERLADWAWTELDPHGGTTASVRICKFSPDLREPCHMRRSATGVSIFSWVMSSSTIKTKKGKSDGRGGRVAGGCSTCQPLNAWSFFLTIVLPRPRHSTETKKNLDTVLSSCMSCSCTVGWDSLTASRLTVIDSKALPPKDSIAPEVTSAVLHCLLVCRMGFGPGRSLGKENFWGLPPKKAANRLENMLGFYKSDIGEECREFWAWTFLGEAETLEKRGRKISGTKKTLAIKFRWEIRRRFSQTSQGQNIKFTSNPLSRTSGSNNFQGIESENRKSWRFWSEGIARMLRWRWFPSFKFLQQTMPCCVLAVHF